MMDSLSGIILRWSQLRPRLNSVILLIDDSAHQRRARKRPLLQPRGGCLAALRHETRDAETTASAAPLTGLIAGADKKAARSTRLARSGARDASFRLYREMG